MFALPAPFRILVLLVMSRHGKKHGMNYMRSRKWWEENMSTITTMWFRGFWTSLAHVVGRYIIPGEYHRVEASINPWILYHVFPAWWAPSTGHKGLCSILTKVYDEKDLVMWMFSLHCESFVLVIIPWSYLEASVSLELLFSKQLRIFQSGKDVVM